MCDWIRFEEIMPQSGLDVKVMTQELRYDKVFTLIKICGKILSSYQQFSQKNLSREC